VISASARLHYEVTAPSSFVFSLAVGTSDRQQIVDEHFHSDPDLQRRHLDDDTGNRLIVLTRDPGPLAISYDAVVALHPFTAPVVPDEETAFADLPVEAYRYLRPSRYCESDLLMRFAARTFGSRSAGVERVQDVCDWVRGHLDYVPGSTDASTTAVDVFHSAAGVCRDFAHLAIALCRALGVPARYVSGYAVGLEPPDFHGSFEAFIGGRWYMFDPTEMSMLDQLVRIATGRDAADVAFATYTGEATLTLLEVSATASPDERPRPDAAPVSTA
jgi:transglutaminase-like putative cysteine protease